MEKIGFLAPPQIAVRAKKKKNALKARSDVWFRGIVFLSGCDRVSLVNKCTIHLMPPTKYLAQPFRISIRSGTNQLPPLWKERGRRYEGEKEEEEKKEEKGASIAKQQLLFISTDMLLLLAEAYGLSQ